jgi:hypothetical protein
MRFKERGHLHDLKVQVSLAQVAHAHNSRYSGDRDQEDHVSNPVQANSS